MLSKVCRIILLSIMLLVLSGCNDTIFPARRISADAADVLEVALAMDASGGKHVATIECPKDHPTPCELVYRYVMGFEAPTARRFTFSPSFVVRYPDIAVDNEGGVYLVWQMCETGFTNCEDYYAFGSPAGFPVAGRLDPLRDSAGPSKLASRGPYVYAVYQVPDGPGTSLRYRQLSPLDHSSGSVSGHPGDLVFSRDQRLSITQDGILHVAWVDYQSGLGKIFVNNNYGTTSNMAHWVWTALGSFSAPAAAVDTDGDRLFFVWLEDNATSDSIWVSWCGIDAQDCTTTGWQGKLDLPAAKHWHLHGGPAITTDDQSAYIAFSAKNDDTGGGYEIFQMRWTPDVSFPAPVQVSHNGLTNGQPFIELVNSFPVIVWRTDIISPGHGDIFWSTFPFTEVFTIRQAQNWNGRDGADVAANGTQMAGVWLEMTDSMSNELDQAWMTFNGYGTYLPLLTAP